MNESLIIYSFCALLLIDYFEDNIPLPHMLYTFWVRSPHRVLLYTFATALKRKWFPYGLAFIIALIYWFLSQTGGELFIYLFFLSIVSPYFSYYPKYRVIKYLFFTLPFGTRIISHAFYFPLVCLFVLISSLRLFKQINAQGLQRKKEPFFPKINKPSSRYWYVIAFVSFMLLPKLPFYKQIPIEQAILIGIIYLTYQLENDLLTNKTLLATFRARAYMNVVKSSQVNLYFFKKKPLETLKNQFSWLLFFSLFLGLQSGIFWDFCIFILGILVIIASNVDVYLYHFMFQRSIVYANSVVRTLINMFIHAAVFQYTLYYTVIKFIADMPMHATLQLIFRSVSLALFIGLLTFFTIRYVKLFKN